MGLNKFGVLLPTARKSALGGRGLDSPETCRQRVGDGRPLDTRLILGRAPQERREIRISY